MKFFTAVMAVLCTVLAFSANQVAANNWNWNFGNWGNWGWGGNSYPSPTKQCPTQTEYNDAVRLSFDPTAYPVQAIADELAARLTLAACLARQIVLPNAPTVPYDPVVGTSSATCPVDERKLWSYISVTNTGRCWVLQNFQEPVHYVSCLTTTCRNCKAYQSTSSEQACLKIYRYVQVYAYCESLPLNARIVTERLIVPQDCSCRKIQCYGRWK